MKLRKKSILILIAFTLLTILTECKGNTGVDTNHDDVSIISHSIKNIQGEYYEISFIIQNNTEQTITYQYIGIKEIGENNVVKADFDSWNQNSMVTDLEPTQSVEQTLLFEISNNPIQIEVNTYCYIDAQGNEVEKKFTQKYLVDLSQSVESTSALDNNPCANLSEIEPYLHYFTDPDDEGTVHLKSDEYNNLSSVAIGDILGTIDYTGLGLGYGVVNVIDKMSWTSNDSGYTTTDFDKIRNTIAEYYSVSTDNNSIFDTENVKYYNDYYSIECTLTQEGRITVNWDINDEKYNKGKIAALVTINDLKKKLKNPESLQIHSAKYSTDAYCTECANAIGICIEYSAQNGFGGYNREYYCRYIDLSNVLYNVVDTFIDPESEIKNSTLHQVDFEPGRNIKESYPDSLVTHLATLSKTEQPELEPIMDDKLIAYLEYLKIPFSETGFRQEDTWNAKGTSIILDDAELMGHNYKVYLWYSGTNGISEEAVANSIQIKYRIAGLSKDEIINSIIENFGEDSRTEATQTFNLIGTEYRISVYDDELYFSLSE